MSVIEKVRKALETTRESNLIKLSHVVSGKRREDEHRRSYEGRQIYEMLQNADDCHTPEVTKINVKLELKDDGLLIIQNNGKAFSDKGIESLLEPNYSPKDENSIGNKGLGFRSLLNWTDDIQIITRDFVVSYSEQNARDELEYYKNKASVNAEELDQLEHTAILVAPLIEEYIADKYPLLENEYSTAIILRCGSDKIDDIKKQLSSLRFEELLFLDHTERIEIVSKDINRTIKANKTGEIDDIKCQIIENSQVVSEWRLWDKSGERLFDDKSKKYNCKIAVPLGKDVADRLKSEAFLYNYFATKIHMPFPFLVHGTFGLNGERNQLYSNDAENEFMLDVIVDEIIRVNKIIANDVGTECNYTLLDSLLPENDIPELKEYGFVEKLKNKIRKSKVFPSISGDYYSCDDKPIFSRIKYADYLKKETTPHLLQSTTNEKILKFIDESKIGFVNDSKLVEIIDKDADWYVANDYHLPIIELFRNNYPNCQRGPHLIVDSNGDRIVEDDVKVFSDFGLELDLPLWGKVTVIDPKMEKWFKDNWSDYSTRTFGKYLKQFGCEEFNISKVLSELIRQSGKNHVYEKELIGWLFKYWLHNSGKFEAKINNVFTVEDRNGEILKSSECYVGGEYGNEVGERLLTKAGITHFLAEKTVFGLKDYDNADLIRFFNEIGISSFPKITKKEFKSNELSAKGYIEANKKVYKTLVTTKPESVTYEQVFHQRNTDCQVIKVDYIENLVQIIEKSKFEDVIFWMLNDEDFSNRAKAKNESEGSVITTKLKSDKTISEISKDYMISWIGYVLATAKWIVCDDGCRHTIDECTLDNQDFYPVLFNVTVDYQYLNRLNGKSTKYAVRDLLNQIGIAESFADLPKGTIYKKLGQLSGYDTSCRVGRKLYTQMNLSFKDQTLDELVTNNPEYDHFLKHGKVLCESEGKLKYVDVSDAYYVDKKVFSDDFLDKFNKLALGRRAGSSKVKKMLGVRPIEEVGTISVSNPIYHPLDEEYKKEFKKLLPYLYCKRLPYDKSKKEFNKMRKCVLSLVNDIDVVAKIGEDTKTTKLGEYELVYWNDQAFIRIPNNVETIDELRSETSFVAAVADVITTMIDVSAERDAYIIILGRNSTADIESYFEQSDGDLMTQLAIAKSRFTESVDYRDEFWQALSDTVGEDKNELISKYSRYLKDSFDYTTSPRGADLEDLIALFKELGIKTSDYNRTAFVQVSFLEYHKAKLEELRNEYRAKFFTYLATKTIENRETISSFEPKRVEYNVLSLDFENEATFDVRTAFEAKLGVKLDDIDKYSEDFEELIQRIPEDETIVEEHDEDTENATENSEVVGGEVSEGDAPEISGPIDYAALNEEIANSDEVTQENVTMKSPKKHGRGKHHSSGTGDQSSSGGREGRDYDQESEETKKLNGFMAESRVYNFLKKRAGSLHSVEWVSSNGKQAGVRCNAEHRGDSLGYDIVYTNEQGKHYVEVKSTSSGVLHFKMSKNEFDFATKNKDSYELWFVFIKDGRPQNPINLGNIMKFENGENFFNNSKFIVEYDSFEVRSSIVKE